jgi:hypothetical protein
VESSTINLVLAGLDPAIHVVLTKMLRPQGVDARHKAGHDGLF